MEGWMECEDKVVRRIRIPGKEVSVRALFSSALGGR